MTSEQMRALKRIAKESPHPGEREAARLAVARLQAKQPPPLSVWMGATADWISVVFNSSDYSVTVTTT